MPRRPPLHPVLSTRVASSHRDAAVFRTKLPINYLGSFEDNENTRRPRLKDLAEHTLFLGATGSGKTTAMKLHMWSVLPAVDPRFSMNYRSLVYDPKTDLLPFFGRMGFSPDAEIVLTNPFDRRSACWDVAKDIVNEADAQSFAELLVTDHPGQEFWQATAREVVAATIAGLNFPDHNGSRRAWDLRDLVLVLDEPLYLKQVLLRTQEGEGALRDYLETDARVASSIRATLRSNLAPYRLIAALWDHARYSFSFKDWCKGAGILFVGDHYKYSGPMQRVNNLLLRYGIDSLMDRPGVEDHDLTWLYLDELKSAGRFPNFGTMLTQGRSKGIRAVLAGQGLSTLESAFPEGQEKEVLNNCGNKAILQLGSDYDARWAEQLFSTARRQKSSFTIPNDPRQEGSRTVSEEKESLVEAKTFLGLESASDHGGAITAYYHGRGAVYSHNSVPSHVVDRAMPPPVPRQNLPPDFVPRLPEHFVLRAFDAEDRKHLGLQGGEGGEDPPLAPSSPFRVPPSPR